MEKQQLATNSPALNKDDLIVIAGAGGFIAGSLTRYFHERGFTRIRRRDFLFQRRMCSREQMTHLGHDLRFGAKEVLIGHQGRFFV